MSGRNTIESSLGDSPLTGGASGAAAAARLLAMASHLSGRQ